MNTPQQQIAWANSKETFHQLFEVLAARVATISNQPLHKRPDFAELMGTLTAISHITSVPPLYTDDYWLKIAKRAALRHNEVSQEEQAIVTIEKKEDGDE